MIEKIKEYFHKLIARGIIAEGDLKESTVTAEQIQELEQEFHITFPEVYKDYLMTYSYDFTELKGVVLTSYGELDEQLIEIINIPQENPLQTVCGYLGGVRGTGVVCFDDEEIFLASGYLPFGDWGAGWGVVCFDTNKKESEADIENPDTWTICWFDHEEILDGGDLKELAIPAAPTFFELLEWFFAGKLQEAYERE